MMTDIAAVLACEVRGVDGTPHSLGDLVAGHGGPTVLVFVRHFG